MSYKNNWIAYCQQGKASSLAQYIENRNTISDTVDRNVLISDILASGKYWTVYWTEYAPMNTKDVVLLIVFNEWNIVDSTWWDNPLCSVSQAAEIGMDNHCTAFRAYISNCRTAKTAIEAMQQLFEHKNTKPYIGDVFYFNPKTLEAKFNFLNRNASPHTLYRLIVCSGKA